jgi:hypothetical protein
MSERRACQLVNQPRGTQRYQPTQREDEDPHGLGADHSVWDKCGAFRFWNSKAEITQGREAIGPTWTK